MIELQQKLLSDRIRNERLYAAMKQYIKKGVTEVADIGSGTGFLAFMASRLGAKRCYLYECTDLLNLSKKIAAKNGIANCVFIKKHSTEVKNPAKADLVISETLGNFALEEHILETLNDARRFLKPGGKMIPERLEQYAAPVVSNRIQKEIDAWNPAGFDLNYTDAREAGLNNIYVHAISPDELLNKGRQGASQTWDCIDFEAEWGSMRRGAASWKINLPKKIYGFALWWKAYLTSTVYFSTSPFDPQTHWQQVYAPLNFPINAGSRDTLDLEISSDSRLETGLRLRWTAYLRDSRGHLKETIRMDTARGYN